MNNEWYTLPKYIEAAREVMGSIDLDPASAAEANKIVKATRYYTREQNGLEQEWKARNVWLNPPYGRTAKMQGFRKSTIRLFLDKLIEHYERGDIYQAIALVTTEINAGWFQPLWMHQYYICVPDHRVHFIIPAGRPRGDYVQMFGTCFAYLGPNEEDFIHVFRQFGSIVKAIAIPSAKPAALPLWGVAV